MSKRSWRFQRIIIKSFTTCLHICFIPSLSIIVYNNVLYILTIQAHLSPNLLKGMQVIEFGMLLLALILNNLLLYFTKVRSAWMYVEANVATIVFLGPLILWRPFFQRYLREQPFFYSAYLASILTILTIAFYITNEIIKESSRIK